MSNNTLFAINSIGRVYSLSTAESLWKPVTYLGVDFVKVVTSNNFIWAIGCDHRLYVYVFDLGVPIRVKEELYENQRWTPGNGFSNVLLKTDRYNFSNDEGTEERSKDKVLLPSLAWSWDGNWNIEETSDGQPLGKEGWTYAIDFPAVYQPEKQWNSFVRRRKWYRYRRYVAENSWSAISSLHADSTKEPFFDIAIGGWNIPGNKQGVYCVWAVTALSAVIFRVGVSTSCPEGTGWLPIGTPNECDVKQISTNSSGQLWAVCWDGKILCRVGVSRNCVQGTDWTNLVCFPNVKFSSIALGEKSIWGVDRDCNVWFHDHTNKCITDEINWVQICGSMSALSIGANDQIFGVSSEDGCIYLRSGITHDELSGQSWVKIICDIDKSEALTPIDNIQPVLLKRSSESSLDSSDSDSFQSGRDNNTFGLPGINRTWRCVAAGSIDLLGNPITRWTVPDYCGFQISDGPWKAALKEMLTKRNLEECDKFPEIPRLVEQSSWIKSGKCKYYVAVLNSWVDATIELDWPGKKTDNYEDGTLAVFYKCFMLEKVLLRLEDITCIMPVFNKALPIILVYDAKTTSLFNPYRIQFASLADCEDWLSTLTLGCSTMQGSFGKAGDSSMWITTTRGDIFAHHTKDEEVSPEKLYWQQYGGHLLKIESCTKGVTWGQSYNNDVWVYTGGYGGGVLKGSAECKALLNTMMDYKKVYIYENQRWNPLTGYTSHGLPTDRHSWSDKSGLQCCTKEATPLPSPQWSWAGDWSIDYNVSGGVDEEGWQYAVDFPMAYHSHKGLTDYVRRRRWERKCQITTTGPWLKPDKMKVKDISLKVLPSEVGTDRVVVWCVSTDGEVILREGVTVDNPAGESWTHLPTDQNIVSASISLKNRLWAVTSSGSALVRIGMSETKPLGDQWVYVEPPAKARLKYISAGNSEVWAIDRHGNLYRRKGVMNTLPEGTEWTYVTSFICDLSVSNSDQIWCILEEFPFEGGNLSGILAKRSGITTDHPIGEGWYLGLGGGLHSVSVRGVY